VPREQDQFLDVVDRDTAERRWLDLVRPEALPTELVPLAEALDRVLAEDIRSDVDVPAFDRSNLDGYAVVAADTFGAAEEASRLLRLNDEELTPGACPRREVAPGTATPIATGGMLPRGADAVVMVELTRLEPGGVRVFKPVAPGAGVAFAGTDLARGELVLAAGCRLTSRETGVLAAIGRATVPVVRRPSVAILSTGDELVEPGRPLPPAHVHDANATMLADAVRELGGEAIRLGIVPDDEATLEAAFERALAVADVVLLSGGTSKGAGDLSYRALARRRPGLVVHGVALKPGKPICLGAAGATPVAILPGFPTSAIFTFGEFVAPLLRRLAGMSPEDRETISARLPHRVNSERGRTEYVLVNLVEGPDGPLAFPLGKGSGSVTTFSRADGVVTIAREREYLDAGAIVPVLRLGRRTEPADLVVVGSHCIGLDALLCRLARESGLRSKTIWVGSQGGLVAAGQGACDLAGIHLLDPATDRYNAPFLPEGVRLLPGYGRMQGVVFRAGEAIADRPLAGLAADPALRLVNRNRGSGTRVLIDGLLAGHRPPGYAVEVKSHNAVAAAVAQGRADWGVAIEPVARAYGLGFRPLRAEHYDFAVPEARWDRPAVAAFRALLSRPDTRDELARLGFLPPDGDDTP
jgi:putative molybdopterin biosynthesis protein